MTTATDTPRVWIGCLAAYNEGHLHGEWTDADDLETLNEVAARVLKSSPATFAEELFLADNEGFGDLIGEYTPFQRVAEIAQAIEEHGRAFIAWGSYDSCRLEDVDQAVEEFQEAYCGEWDSFKDYAMDYAEQTGAVRDSAAWPYTSVDWDAAADELEQDYTYVDGFVFRAY